MYRVTTPYHTFTLPIQTSQCKIIQVTYEQNQTQLVKQYENETLPSGMTLDGKNVIIRLTQDETKGFAEAAGVLAQVRVLTNANDAYASQKFEVDVDGVLNEEILTDG